jgi:pimeloyl-ACP methyl ester carboxylesterase
LGASPRAAALIDQLWGRLFKFYVEGEWSVELEQLLRQVYEDEELQRLPKHPDHGPGLQPVPPTRPIEQLKGEYGRAWPDGGFDVAAVYADLKCPILCVWGEQDNVLPLEEGIERVKRALAESHHPFYRLYVAPNATHKLYTVSPEPQAILAETMHTYLHNVSFTPGIRDLMADWAVSVSGKC